MQALKLLLKILFFHLIPFMLSFFFGFFVIILYGIGSWFSPQPWHVDLALSIVFVVTVATVIFVYTKLLRFFKLSIFYPWWILIIAIILASLIALGSLISSLNKNSFVPIKEKIEVV